MSNAKCIVCQSNEATPLFRTCDRHYGIPGEFDLIRCLHCGLVRLDPVPTADELGAMYAEDYYAYQPQRKDFMLKRLARKILVTKIVTHNPKISNPGEFLDIGCGSGDYLHLMKAKGWRVRGVEPSSFGASEGKRAGLDIFNGTLHDANFPSDSFDYVRANHSFEHIPNPVEVLSEVHRIVKPGGKIFIGVPNIDSLPYRMFGKYWWYLGAPVHTYNYSLTTLSTLVGRAGFVVEKVYFNSNFASLLGSLQIYANRNSNRKSTEGWLYRNHLLKLIAGIVEKGIDLVGQGDAIEVICRKTE